MILVIKQFRVQEYYGHSIELEDDCSASSPSESPIRGLRTASRQAIVGAVGDGGAHPVFSGCDGRVHPTDARTHRVPSSVETREPRIPAVLPVHRVCRRLFLSQPALLSLDDRSQRQATASDHMHALRELSRILQSRGIGVSCPVFLLVESNINR